MNPKWLANILQIIRLMLKVLFMVIPVLQQLDYSSHFNNSIKTLSLHYPTDLQRIAEFNKKLKNYFA